MPKGYVPFYSLSGATTTGAGIAADTSGSTADMFMQVTISATATVKVEASEDLRDWVDVSAIPGGYTASTIVKLDARVPFYRANVVSISSGTVSAVVSSGKGRHKELMNVGGPQASGSNSPDFLLQFQDKVPNSRRIDTTAPLTGGGDLSADRTLALTTSPAGQTPVGVTRLISTTAPLTGGGDLSADRTLGVSITPANPGGAVALQAATPGTQQVGHLNINGTVKSNDGSIVNIITASVTGDVVYSGITINITGTYSTSKMSSTLANGDNNNVSLTSSGLRHSFIGIIGPTAGFAITGFVAPGGGLAQWLHVYNEVAQVMTIKNLTTSSAANQILTLTGADVVLRAGTSFASFIYDPAGAVWVLMSTN